MTTFTPIISFAVFVAIIALLWSCSPQPSVRADDLPPMRSTAWVATPTPIIAAPVIFTEFVWVPVVRK